VGRGSSRSRSESGEPESGEQLIVYKCIVCGKAFTKRQSLMAHLASHRDIEWAHLDVRIPKEKLERFKEFCRRHNTTTCHMIMTFIDAVMEAMERSGNYVEVKPFLKGAIGGSNPVIVNVQVHQYFMSKPRGKGKYDFSKLDLEGCVLCGGKPYALCYRDGREYPLCRDHFIRNRDTFDCYTPTG